MAEKANNADGVREFRSRILAVRAGIAIGEPIQIPDSNNPGGVITGKITRMVRIPGFPAGAAQYEVIVELPREIISSLGAPDIKDKMIYATQQVGFTEFARVDGKIVPRNPVFY